MSAAEAQSEPTMEEILASIRRIISEDDAPAAEAASEDNVLELSQPIEEEAVSFDEPEDKANDQGDIDYLFEDPIIESNDFDDIIEPEADEHEIIAVDMEPEPSFDEELASPLFEEPAPIVSAPSPQPQNIIPPQPQIQPQAQAYIPPTPAFNPSPLAETIGLIGEGAATATATAFSRLGSALPNHFATGASVEELVAYLLKPMLKDWLDNNLPRIVEERVEAELARIARRGF